MNKQTCNKHNCMNISQNVFKINYLGNLLLRMSLQDHNKLKATELTRDYDLVGHKLG